MGRFDKSIGKLISLCLAAAALTLSCADVEAPCRAIEHLPVPVNAHGLAELDLIRDRIFGDFRGDSNLWLLDSDEATGTVTLGLNTRSPEICEAIHQRYGPLVEVLGPQDSEGGGLY